MVAVAGRRAVAGIAAAAAAAAGVVLWRSTDPVRRDRDVVDDEPRLLGELAGWVPARPATPVGRAVATVWAAPLTVLGLLLAAMGGGRARVVDGAVVVVGAGGPIGVLLRRRGFSGTTLGQCVLVTPRTPSPALLAHELVHVRQAERLGVAFGPLYVALLGRYGYREHPMERAARRGAAGAAAPEARQDGS